MKKLITNSNTITLRKLLLSMALVCTIFICNATTCLVRPQNTTNLFSNGTEIIRDIPIEASFFNECCDEEVYIFGTAQLVVNDNIIHVVVSDMTGTGLSTGYTYTGNGASVETNVFYSNQIEGIFTFKLSMTNEDGCSFRLKATFRIEANANGDIVVSFQNLETKCH